MDRKLLAIVSIFIILVSNAFFISVVGKETTLTNEKKNNQSAYYNNELPDLTVEVQTWRDREYRSWFKIIVYNDGNATIPADEYLTFKIESNYPLIGVQYWVARLEEPLPPGDYWISSNIEGPYYVKCKISVVVDPVFIDESKLYPLNFPYDDMPELNPHPRHGLIEELDEDNNENSARFSKLKSTTNNQLELFIIPFVQRIFKIIKIIC